MINNIDHYTHAYKPSKTKMWNIINRSSSNNLMSIESGSRALYILRIIQEYDFSREMSKNMILIDYATTLSPIMNKLYKNKNPLELFMDELAGVVRFQNNEFIYNDTFILEEIDIAIREKKYIFVIFSFDDYDVDNIKGINEYCGHSTCALFTPNKKNYDCYYINPHGRDDTKYFKQIVTNKRCKVYYYKKALDIIFMIGFIESINTISKIKINYSDSYRYNYKGVNLQSGDCYGVCFAFPYIIYYYIGKYLTRPRYFMNEDENIYIESGIKLLKNGRLGFFVEMMFADFSEKYKNKLFDKKYSYRTNREKTEKFVINNAGHFLKSVVSPMISMMLQTKIKNILSY